MRFNKIKAKTALLIAGKTQEEIAKSVELSRRWVGAAFNGRKSATKPPGTLPPLWAYPWTI